MSGFRSVDPCGAFRAALVFFMRAPPRREPAGSSRQPSLDANASVE
jgi:hypothetical protein